MGLSLKVFTPLRRNISKLLCNEFRWNFEDLANPLLRSSYVLTIFCFFINCILPTIEKSTGNRNVSIMKYSKTIFANIS